MMLKRQAALVIAVGLVLALLDVATTWLLLAHGGIEENPVMRAVLEQHGLAMVLAFKLAVIAGLAVAWTGIAYASGQVLSPRTAMRVQRAALIVLALPLVPQLLVDLSNGAVILAQFGLPVPHL